MAEAEKMETTNIHVVDLTRVLSKVCENVYKSQSRRLNRIKARDGDRIKEYLDRIEDVIATLKLQKDKDNPEADARGLTKHIMATPVSPEAQENTHINMLAMEVYQMHVELCYGPSSKNTSGLHIPDLRMLEMKLLDARQILADGQKDRPAIHYVFGENEGVGGPDAS